MSIPGSAPLDVTPATDRPAQEPDQLRRDAAWVAGLYPVRHRPVAAPWHPSCIHVPASIRGLVDGMPGYGA